MFSVLILTLNEEENILPCLASAAGCDDLVVLDSGSTDATCERARSVGARIFTRRFDHFGGQRNYAHEHIAFRHPWVFHLDADERLLPGLLEECARLNREDPGELDGFYAAPRMLWQGRWLRRCTDFPAWQARFAHAQRFRFIQAGHGQREDPSMRLGYLKGNYDHEMCAEGVEAWLEKHRRYARQEAAEAWARRQGREPKALPGEQAGVCPGAGASRGGGEADSLFSGNALARRRALKALAARLPARPLARFLDQYVLRRGFLDGPASLRYCLLLARYEAFIARETGLLKRSQ